MAEFGIHANMILVKDALKPIWQSYLASYAKPYKIPAEQIAQKIETYLKDPYFYGYAVLGTSAWFHFASFFAAMITGLYFTGCWDYIQENYSNQVKFVSGIIPLPLKDPNSENNVSLFDKAIQKATLQENPDTKIVSTALIFFLAWITSYTALIDGFMLGNHIWHVYNQIEVKQQ